jgi:hypothetical protein
LPAYRAIYEALLSLPADAPIGDALSLLDERGRDAWARLVEHGQPGDGYDLDRDYAGALEALDEIHSFPAIDAEVDPATRRQRWLALSKEGQARFRLYVANGSRARAARDSQPAKE